MSSRDPRGVQEALSRRRDQGTIRRFATRPADSADFSSNDFLSLASNEELWQNYLVSQRTLRRQAYLWLTALTTDQ